MVLHEHMSKLAERRGMMSDVTPLAPEMPQAQRCGADLRVARERLGWALDDIAAGLHIPLRHLEALEEGRIALLPGNAYAVGYVRGYASALGLDSEEMVRRFKAEAAEVGQRTELMFPAPMPDSGLPAGAVMLLGLVLSIGAYVGWYHLSSEGRLPAEAVTPVPERLAPLAQQALPPPPPQKPVASVDAPPIPVPAPTVATTDAAPAPAVAPISPTSAAAALIREPTSIPPAASVQPSDASRIVLRATADAWIQVKDRSGNILLNRVLRAGDSWPVPRQDNLILTTGNAGGTDILVDGVATPSLGGAGVVRRDVALDADAIKAGKVAATVPQLVAAHGRQ